MASNQSNRVHSSLANWWLLLFSTTLLCTQVLAAPAAKEPTNQQLFQLAGAIWVTFYDLPSRRFRSGYDAFIQRDFERAISELTAAAHFLRIEEQRVHPKLRGPLVKAGTAMEQLTTRLATDPIPVSQLHPLFANAH